MEVLNRQTASESAATHSVFHSSAARRFVPVPLVWWHLLSLDAPTIAVLWCWFFAAAFGIRFRWMVLPTLALGTWCVYIADRLLDGLLSTDTTILRDRHWFYVRHRKFFAGAWIAAAIPLVYLILFQVQPSVRRDDILLGWIGVSYFAMVHGLRRGSIHWFPKELAVGFLFAIATAVPALARTTTMAETESLALAVMAFGAACWLNCVAIQVWEDAEVAQELAHDILKPGNNSRTRDTAEDFRLTQYLGHHLMVFTAVLAAASSGLAFITANTPAWPLFLSVALSAFLFGLLVRYSSRFSALTLRIAADAALLTPLLFLLRGL